MSFPISVANICSALDAKVVWLPGTIDPRGVDRVSMQEGTPDCISFSNVTVDSRDAQFGSLFVARRGETQDGHSFIAAALSQGAFGALVERDWFDSDEGKDAISKLSFDLSPSRRFCLIPVIDTTKALGQLAHLYRHQWASCSSGPVVAITGSVGKTAAKEYTAHILTKLFGHGAYNKKSFNNHVGLPLSILSADEKHSWMVLEAGMNHAGELDYLGGVSEPDISVLLNVGPVHLEHFDGQIARIADAKCELIARTRSRAWVNGDDEEVLSGLERLRTAGIALPRIFTFAKKREADLRSINVHQTPDGFIEMKVLGFGQEAQVRFEQWGQHHSYNALAAMSVAFEVNQFLHRDFTLQEIADSFVDLKGIPMRFERRMIGKTMLINDAYNANPISMAGAIKTASELAREKVLTVVLGDMLELGPESSKFHYAIGQEASKLGVYALICMGKFAADTAAGAKQGGLSNTFAVDKYEQVIDCIRATGVPDVLLVKASRGMAFENVIAAFEESFG